MPYLMNIIINFKEVLLVAAIPLLFAASCNKGETRPCVNVAYNFTVTSEWTPQKQIYNIGDTIFLNSSFSKNLVDINSNYKVNYSNAKGIVGNCIIYELDTLQHQVLDGVQKFDFIELFGNLSSNKQFPNRIKDIFYQELSNSYSLKIGIICKSKGLYDFSITDLGSQGIIGKNCTNASFANTLTNSDKNIDLFQYAMNRQPVSQFEIERIYCFRIQ
jgi:hypothetical protein